MPDNPQGTLELVAEELGKALSTLSVRFHDPRHALHFLAELGLDLPESVLTPQMIEAMEALHTVSHQLPALIDELRTAIASGQTTEIVLKGANLLRVVLQCIRDFSTLSQNLDAIGPSASITLTALRDFAAVLPKRLLDVVVIEHLEENHASVAAIFELLGIVSHTLTNPGSTDPSHPEFVKSELRVDRIASWLQSPDTMLLDLYKWGQPDFKGNLLIDRIAALLESLDVVVTRLEFDGAPVRHGIEIELVTLAPTAGLSLPGLDVVLTDGLAQDFSYRPDVGSGWNFHLGLSGGLQASTGVRLLPPMNFSVIPPQGQVQGRFTTGVAKLPIAGASNVSLLALAGGSGLTARRIGVDLISAFSWNSSANAALGSLGFAGRIEGGALKLTMQGADGFIGSVVPGSGIEAAFDIDFGWIAGQGVRFSGSGGLEVLLPTHIALGPIEIKSLTLRAGLRDRAIPVALMADIAANLGPLKATVVGIGAEIAIAFPAEGDGNAGPLSLDFRFKPPNGVGLSLNAGPVRGGGFLLIDPERGEYAGALELTFAEFLSLKAVGVITTRMPDGSDGFSLVIIVTAEFGSGLQLGFGFTLLGVGGLLGLNRTVNADALLAGVKTGAINNIMFPQNVGQNAPRIISDLRAIFPPRNGVFLIGPMAKLGWGTPTLVSISLGVIIEIPGNVSILGVLRVALPAETAPIVQLQVSFVGRIEFDRKRLYFFASLFDSRVLSITLDGDMGLLAAFGEDANFVLSVGGFHPRFTPPPLPFPTPTRISASILNESWGRIRAEGYFAVTSNTAQFGARSEIFFGFSALSVESTASFDALFQFSPFRFSIETSSHFSVKVFGLGVWGLSIKLLIEGPAPWRAKGRASISLLFFDIPVSIDETWGERRGETLPPVSIMPLLEAEFKKKENWRAFLPQGRAELVTLRQFASDENALVLHPAGALRVLQKLAPLDITVSKLGNRKADDGKKFSVAVAAGPFSKLTDAKERFAAAEFNDLTDALRLAAAAFENQNGGLDLAPQGQGAFSATAIRRTNRYELITIDSQGERPRLRLNFHVLDARFVGRFHKGAAAAMSVLSAKTKTEKNPFRDKVAATGERFAVASSETNTAIGGGKSFASEAAAREFMTSVIADDPALAGNIHVVSAFELAA